MLLHNFSLTVTSWAKFRDIQIVIVANFVVVSSIGIKRIDCSVNSETFSAGSKNYFGPYWKGV